MTSIPVHQIPHPYLRINGKPTAVFPKKGTLAPERDPGNFSLDGRLGQLLRSQTFARFMVPFLESPDSPARTTDEIWYWVAGRLGLGRWRSASSVDLEWFATILQDLDFMVQCATEDGPRWFHEGWACM